MTLALIPACGKSTRMGRPKLALPLGSCTVLERVVAALRQAEIEHILVVLAPHVRELQAIAERAGADVLMLADETTEMRETIELGLDFLENRLGPSLEDDWLLVPADHPTLDAEVVERLILARRDHASFSIFIPTYQGKRGHPALIGWKHVAGIRSLPPGMGLNTYLRTRANEVCEIPVENAEVLRDLDTPTDYENLRRQRGP